MQCGPEKTQFFYSITQLVQTQNSYRQLHDNVVARVAYDRR
jgi:hypothetical protein